MKSPQIFTEARFKLESAPERTVVVLWFYTQGAEGYKPRHKCLDGALGLLPARNM